MAEECKVVNGLGEWDNKGGHSMSIVISKAEATLSGLESVQAAKLVHQ